MHKWNVYLMNDQTLHILLQFDMLIHELVQVLISLVDLVFCPYCALINDGMLVIKIHMFCQNQF